MKALNEIVKENKEAVDKARKDKISVKAKKALDDFLLNEPDISEEEREEILERIG